MSKTKGFKYTPTKIKKKKIDTKFKNAKTKYYYNTLFKKKKKISASLIHKSTSRDFIMQQQQQ